ncbi:MAG: hypothetical protein PHT02_00050 [Tissierellia bacterium]|nr:hypothetical protein [Tissierellia bacterium]
MSSTNRSKARDSHTSDYYKTPIDQIVKFLKEFNKHEDVFIKPYIKILDCCAGGLIEKDLMSYPEALKQIGIHNVDTIDIREDSLADIKVDYLTYDCKNKYDVIITNPPFSIAEDIIKKALDDVKDNGWVIMLLRLNFFEGKSRKDFWLDNMAKYSFVHSKRMSFTDNGGTDSVAYMHCVFQKSYNPEFCKLKVI